MIKMRKILKFLMIALIAYSCGSNGNIGKSKGELVGIKGKKYFSERPFGMVLVPGGSYIMGKSDDDMPAIQDAPTKTVTVRSFYMDETEVTNAQFKTFIEETGYVTLAERPFKKEDYPKAKPEDLVPAAFVMASPKTNVDVKSESHWSWWKSNCGYFRRCGCFVWIGRVLER